MQLVAGILYLALLIYLLLLLARLVLEWIQGYAREFPPRDWCWCSSRWSSR